MGLRNPLILAIMLFAWTATGWAGEIHQAVSDGDLERVAQMLKEDPALVSAQNENQTRDLPLHTAAFHGQVAIAALLLKTGAAVDGGDSDKSTPLDVAALRGQKEMVEMLISRGANVNHRDNNGAYSLSFAAFGGKTEIVQILLAAGADLDYQNPRGITLLHAAASRGLADLYDILVEHGADINAQSTDGETPLHWATARGQTAMVEKLLASGADENARDNYGQTPLMGAAHQGQVETARLLIAGGADVNATDQSGRSALHMTTWSGNTEYAELLLANECDPDLQDESGTTALMSAAFRGHPDLVAALLSNGAKTNLKENRYERTALHAAAAMGYTDITENLLAHGADLEAKDAQGNTPTQLAARYQQQRVLQALLVHGADQQELAGLPANPGVVCKVNGGEAAVWYLGHSAWAVKTQNHLLIFDYWDQGRPSDNPCLGNGHIQPAEIAGLNVAVFASHEHTDHYDPLIFGWRDSIAKIGYYLGCQPADAAEQQYSYIGPREVRDVEGMKIATIESNDSGVGWLVEVDGIQIYHAGDHANRQQDFSGPYKAEIDFLAATGYKPDLAFMPISGCGFGDQEAVKMGVHYALETLQPAVFLPMHSGGNPYRYQEFVNECQKEFPQIEMLAVEGRGDHFFYVGGKISRQASLAESSD